MNHSLFVPTDSRAEPEPAFRNGSESVRKTGILPPLNRDSPFIPPHSFRSKRPLGKRRSVYSGTGAETLSSDSILRLFYGRMRKMNGKAHLIFRTPPPRGFFRNETHFFLPEGSAHPFRLPFRSESGASRSARGLPSSFLRFLRNNRPPSRTVLHNATVREDRRASATPLLAEIF